jgi:hypothetical protein
MAFREAFFFGRPRFRLGGDLSRLGLNKSPHVLNRGGRGVLSPADSLPG